MSPRPRFHAPPSQAALPGQRSGTPHSEHRNLPAATLAADLVRPEKLHPRSAAANEPPLQRPRRSSRPLVAIANRMAARFAPLRPPLQPANRPDALAGRCALDRIARRAPRRRLVAYPSRAAATREKNSPRSIRTSTTRRGSQLRLPKRAAAVLALGVNDRVVLSWPQCNGTLTRIQNPVPSRECGFKSLLWYSPENTAFSRSNSHRDMQRRNQK
jgi:hypothetical protein